MSNTTDVLTADESRRIAVSLFNGVWELLDVANPTAAQRDEMIHAAHASRYHWAQAEGTTPHNLARGEWQCSRVYATLRMGQSAIHHAQRCLELCQEHSIGDWDLAFAYEALARAHAVDGQMDTAAEFAAKAHAALPDIAEDADREVVAKDLATLPLNSVTAQGNSPSDGA